MSAAILVWHLQGENFFQVEKFEVSHFQAVHRVSKNAVSPREFNRLTNHNRVLLCARMWNNRYLKKIAEL